MGKLSETHKKVLEKFSTLKNKPMCVFGDKTDLLNALWVRKETHDRIGFTSDDGPVFIAKPSLAVSFVGLYGTSESPTIEYRLEILSELKFVLYDILEELWDRKNEFGLAGQLTQTQDTIMPGGKKLYNFSGEIRIDGWTTA